MNWVIAGARPIAMWVAVLTFLYSGIGLSILNCIAINKGWSPFPAVDSVTMDAVLYSLLGISAARSFDKYHGIDTKIEDIKSVRRRKRNNNSL